MSWNFVKEDSPAIQIFCIYCVYSAGPWWHSEGINGLMGSSWGNYAVSRPIGEGGRGRGGCHLYNCFLGGLTFLYLYLLLVTVFALVLVLHMKYAALHYRRKNIGQQGLGRGVGESSFVFASLPGIANPPPSSFLISYFYFVFCICVLYFDMLPSSSLARVAYSCTNYERSYKFQVGFQDTILNVAIC